jgi:hypothetical protein
LQANWGAFDITVSKDAAGVVTFDASNVSAGSNDFEDYSPALAGRLE